MINALEITDHNRQAHIDIEDAIAKQQNGLFTFILRINNGNIVDFNLVYVSDAGKYLKLKQVIIEEFTIAHDISVGSKSDSVRSVDNERNT